MTKQSYITFLRSESLNSLYKEYMESPTFISRYWDSSFTEIIDERLELQSDIEFDIIKFDFHMPVDGDTKDAENSIHLHSILELDRVTASDLRLWAYLTHLAYPAYVKRRWLNYGRRPIDEKYYGTKKSIWSADKNIEIWNSLTSSIESRYFFTGLNTNIETLNRNAISRLWWGAHLTYDDKRNESDPYELTRILFSLQTLHQALLERSLGSNPIIRAATLEFFLENEAYLKDKFARPILKFLNLLAGPKVIALNNKEWIKDKLSEFVNITLPEEYVVA